MPNQAFPKIDLNTAEESVLVERLNISPRLAKRILSMRPYESVEQLNRVWGIDPETIQHILPLVYIGSDPAAPGIEAEHSLSTSSNQADFAEQPLPSREPTPPNAPQRPKIDWKINFALLLILLVGAYFRFTGLNWDNNQHQHPDERFITMVTEQIRGVPGIAEFFDTEKSTLNPLRFGSYTYGMLPLFITRMIAEWANMAVYDQITLVGRALSGLFDLAAVLMLYLLGKRLYNPRVGLVAAALSAAAVLPIQLSHFFAVDSFSTVFVIACFYFGLLAVPVDRPEEKLSRSNLAYFAIFGFLVGMAGACKVNTLPVFGVILLAGGIYLVTHWKKPGFRSTLILILQGWGLALLAAFLAFRIFQPYAFSGPGFLGIGINPQWLKVIQEVTDQVAGKSEWPPNHHWTSRPFTYAWINMVFWGLGLPLGLTGWIGLAWTAWRSWKGDWRRHVLPLTWVLAYFLWQNLQFWRYMRYFLPIYPFIILFAAWALVEVYERTRESRANLALQARSFPAAWKGAAGLLVIAVILLGTYGYAFAFTRIYNRPITRVAASQWMLEHIAGPLNFIVETPEGSQSYPIAVFNRQAILPGDTPSVKLQIPKGGTSQKITTVEVSQVGVDFSFILTRDKAGDNIVADGHLIIGDDSADEQQAIPFGDTNLEAGQTYYLHYKIHNSSRLWLSGVFLRSDNPDDRALALDLNYQNQSPGTVEDTITIRPDSPYRINRLFIDRFHQEFVATQTTVKVSIFKDADTQTPLATSAQKLDFSKPGIRLQPMFDFSPLQVLDGTSYQIRYEITKGGPVRFEGEPYTLETGWDDALPLDVNQIDALNGIYSPLNLELYEPDTPEKRDAMIQILAQSSYIVVPSNRAYDAMPRLPLRYPLTLKYYQALFGCDCGGDDLENHAYRLDPPFKSALGFDLVATFSSRPNLGPLTIADDSADESFTVYDHPKVFIFKKSSDFSVNALKSLLYSVDLDQVIFQTPLSYTHAPTAMQLPADRLAAQTHGGSWASIFNRGALLNSNEFLGAAAWYLSLLLLGWMIFPAVFAALPRLPDRGYAFTRIAGLIAVAWLAWILGSLKLLPFTRLAIAACIALILILCLAWAYCQRNDLRDYLRTHWGYILGIEVLFFALFLFILSIRMGNPDLWHPWLGGEKPMDFAFFNATLKAVYFPPENPWFSGHSINYYYYGYVIAAVPTKLLGINPSIAFNLVLPSWFAMTGLGVFGVSYNLIAGLRRPGLSQNQPAPSPALSRGKNIFAIRGLPYLAGVLGVIAVLFLGNFYLLREFWQYLPEVTRPGIEITSPLQRFDAVIAGAGQILSGMADLPGDKGRWYFEPSRPILHNGPDTPIAEFPYFTFLYADLHPHLLAMPIYGLALGWILSLLLCPITRLRKREQVLSLGMAGLIFGSFRAVHTWDFPTFAGLGVLALLWNVWQTRTKPLRQTLQEMALYGAVFAGLAVALYWPFTEWFKTGYSSIQFWTGARTPLGDYLFVFGLILFVMVSLMIRDLTGEIRSAARRWETIAEGRLFNPSQRKVYGIFFICGIILVGLWKLDYQVLAFGLPLLGVIVYLIFFKRGLSTLRRITWILFGLGLAITLFVEIFVLEGDVGRSNMVFRFYDQAWFIWGIAASLALVELIAEIPEWPRRLKFTWIPVMAVLALCAASYALVATGKKMADRWPDIQNPPHTLDGAAFMLGDTRDPSGTTPAIYNDDNRKLDLSLDYAGFQYLEDHASGSPVIVEGHTEEYRWGSRYSIYTGLPTVVGWSWHVRQHNSLLDGSLVDKRIDDVNNFYNTPDIETARQFLNRYRVEYIIVGGLERTYYSPEGIAKFDKMASQGLIEKVFSKTSPMGSLAIYHLSRN